MLHENKNRSRAREYQKKELQIINSTYRCISPQVLGNFVVFPIKIMRRDADFDRIVMLTDKELVVELSQGGNKIFTTYDWREGDEGLRKRKDVLKERG